MDVKYNLKFREFAELYCSSQPVEPEPLRVLLKEVAKKFNPDGFMILRCEMMDSSKFGQRVILPFGGKSTYAVPIEKGRAVSPSGMAASDQSLLEATMYVSELDQ